jgi:hypothetical protein
MAKAEKKTKQANLHPIHTDRLLDFLDELQMLTRSGAEAIRLAREQWDALQELPHLERFGAEAVRRLDLIVVAIRELGGNPRHIGAAARIQAQRGFALMGIGAPRQLRPLCAIENCWNSSIEEDLHITFLHSIVPYLESVHASEVLAPLVENMRREHDARLVWLEQTLHRLLLQRAMRPVDPIDDEDDFPESA